MSRHVRELTGELMRERGAAVCSVDCSAAEVTLAAACGRLFVDDAGLGYVLRPRAWRERADGVARAVAAALAADPLLPAAAAAGG